MATNKTEHELAQLSPSTFKALSSIVRKEFTAAAKAKTYGPKDFSISKRMNTAPQNTVGVYLRGAYFMFLAAKSLPITLRGWALARGYKYYLQAVSLAINSVGSWVPPFNFGLTLVDELTNVPVNSTRDWPTNSGLLLDVAQDVASLGNESEYPGNLARAISGIAHGPAPKQTTGNWWALIAPGSATLLTMLPIVAVGAGALLLYSGASIGGVSLLSAALKGSKNG